MERKTEGMSHFLKGISDWDKRVLPSLFGGTDPFDDPFFSSPFGSLFESGMFGPRAAPKRAKEKGVLIEELGSDGEGQESKENGERSSKSTVEPSVAHPDDIVDDRTSKNVMYKSEPYKVEAAEAQKLSYNVHTCKVTHGGVDGAYYSCTRTRKKGSDGVVVEETKEANKTTGQAQHRISRGIHDKGHTVTRKLNSDGHVDTLQTLHNLDEDELAGFEKAWDSNKGPRSSEQRRDAFSGGWFLPSPEEAQRIRRKGSDNEARPTNRTTKKVVRINID